MSVSNQVYELVSEHTGLAIEQLKPEMFIEEDLGISGDDAWDLMEDFQQKFQVDFSNFDFSLHFGPEAGFDVAKDYGCYPISINHLILIAQEKSWVIPLFNKENYKRTRQTSNLFIHPPNFIRLVGMILLFSSIMILYGWLGATDPECDYSSDVIFTQLRQCDDHIADQKNLSVLYPIGSLLALALGLMCFRFSESNQEKNNKEEASGQ